MRSHPSLARRAFLARMLAAAGGSLVGAEAAAQAIPDAQSAVNRMRAGAASATAHGAALHRAAHQIVDYPRLLDDPWAVPIVGGEGAQALQSVVDRQSRGMRASVVMRSRYAEDRLAAAVARGTRQYVVLGAGLDTFAYRNPHAALDLRVFEVDHPATQAWKRQCLRQAAIPVPETAVWGPVDFETQSLTERLRSAGVRFDRPVFFSLLGVAVYLTRPALFGTLEVVRSCAPGSELVFSFSPPSELLPPAQRARRERTMAAMAELGEPWVGFYHPGLLAAELRQLGFRSTEVLTPEAANRVYFAGRPDGLRVGGGVHMMLTVV
jgi:methyltransferase (TIGR00027 family)